MAMCPSSQVNGGSASEEINCFYGTQWFIIVLMFIYLHVTTDTTTKNTPSTKKKYCNPNGLRFIIRSSGSLLLKMFSSG
jgi:hypothetical protein